MKAPADGTCTGPVGVLDVAEVVVVDAAAVVVVVGFVVVVTAVVVVVGFVVVEEADILDPLDDAETW